MSTKAALDTLTRTWAVELASAGVRVVGVAPGAVETPMAASSGADPDQIAQLRAWQRDHTPMRRVADPREIADVIAFVACDHASFLTGAIVPVDGGAAIA